MNSENSWEFNKKYTPNGTQTLSKMPNRYVEGVYPKTVLYGDRDTLVGDNYCRYIDLIAGLGCISLGYSNEFVNKAVELQLREGISFSLPHQIEGKVAQLLTQLVPWTEMWKFGKNGTDGTTMAVRASRAYTGRDKIMTVGYNGCADVFECQGVRTAGIPKILKTLNTRAKYNDLESFKDLYTKEYACVLLEPMVFDYPDHFLEYLKYMCKVTGTLLIFDEVVTGGRFEGFTASSYFKVEPDLIVLGKALANGFPLCAVGGKRSIMETFERDDFFASGTFGGEAVSLAAAQVTCQILHVKISQMVKNGRVIQTYFNHFGLGSCKGYPTRFTFDFPTKEHKALFMQEMCKNFVLVGHTNFIMADLTRYHMTRLRWAIRESLKVMKEFWDNPQNGLQGSMPVEVMRLRN